MINARPQISFQISFLCLIIGKQRTVPGAIPLTIEKSVVPVARSVVLIALALFLLHGPPVVAP